MMDSHPGITEQANALPLNPGPLRAETLWARCLSHLDQQLPTVECLTWLRPLSAAVEGNVLTLFAPNRILMEQFRDQYLPLVLAWLREEGQAGRTPALEVRLSVGSVRGEPSRASPPAEQRAQEGMTLPPGLNSQFQFENFVEGKSNRIARAAAQTVAQSDSGTHNPLFIYGGVGLGKTHLMHAVGNLILRLRPQARVVYLNSEQFVRQMVAAIQHNRMEEFNRAFRALDALLVDDIQFFAGKERTQEEFFHTFNALIESGSQIIMSCDRYPKEVDRLDDRLKSRFGWGLTVAVDPPDLETRLAILFGKAEQLGHTLPEEVAFFVAKRVRSNVRELEGSLRRVVFHAQLLGRPLTVEFAREALRDLLASQSRQVNIDYIQKTVAEYFHLRVEDLLSNSRSRAVSRPRQVAMALAKELTDHSLPEIAKRFGGRDHTTVLYACRKVQELRESDEQLNDAYVNLLRTLSV